VKGVLSKDLHDSMHIMYI